MVWYASNGAPSACTAPGLLFTLALHHGVLALARRRRREAAGDKGGAVVEGWTEAVLLCGNYGALGRAGGESRRDRPLQPRRCPLCWLGQREAIGLSWCALSCPAAAGDPPSMFRWGVQLVEWVACVILARVMCGSLVSSLALLSCTRTRCCPTVSITSSARAALWDFQPCSPLSRPLPLCHAWAERVAATRPPTPPPAPAAAGAAPGRGALPRLPRPGQCL